MVSGFFEGRGFDLLLGDLVGGFGRKEGWLGFGGL